MLHTNMNCILYTDLDDASYKYELYIIDLDDAS